MLEDAEYGFGAVEQWMPWLLDLRVHQRIDHLLVGFVGERADFLPARPERTAIGNACVVAG